MYEESDFAYRIRRAGCKVKVVRNAKIYHDTENSDKGNRKKNYMLHFMSDARRPFIFARNRVLFHYAYSTKVELLFIICLWIWFFAVYYSYKIFLFRGESNFSTSYRLKLILYYLQGNINGLYLVIAGSRIIKTNQFKNA